MKNSIQTTERTFNKSIKKQVVELLPNAKSFRKSHVAGIGYVYYILNSEKEVIGNVFKEFMKGMKIIIK